MGKRLFGLLGCVFVGSVLFVWRSSAPYVLAGILMICIGITTGRATPRFDPRSRR